MRRSDGELNVSWPLRKAFSEKLATPSKLPETGAAWMFIETGAEPPANRMSGLSEPASTEKFSPRQMPAADNRALRLSALHSTGAAKSGDDGVGGAARSAGGHDLAVAEFDRAERLGGEFRGVRIGRIARNDDARLFDGMADAPALGRHRSVAIRPDRVDVEDRPDELCRRDHDVAAQSRDRRQFQFHAFGVEDGLVGFVIPVGQPDIVEDRLEARPDLDLGRRGEIDAIAAPCAHFERNAILHDPRRGDHRQGGDDQHRDQGDRGQPPDALADHRCWHAIPNVAVCRVLPRSDTRGGVVSSRSISSHYDLRMALFGMSLQFLSNRITGHEAL